MRESGKGAELDRGRSYLLSLRAVQDTGGRSRRSAVRKFGMGESRKGAELCRGRSDWAGEDEGVELAVDSSAGSYVLLQVGQPNTRLFHSVPAK